MSQTATNASLTTFWNMESPLHALLMDKSAAAAEKNLLELEQAGFLCKPQVISTRTEFQKQLEHFPFNIVLSDYWLQDWTGMEAFSAMQQAGRDVPFILVTETLGEEAAVECIKQGITDLVLKKRLSRLPNVVTRALEERAVCNARHLMIQALRESEGNSLFLFAQNPLPMWVFELESLQFLQVNDAAVRHYGYTRTEFLQMNAGVLHPAEEIPKLLGAIRDAQPQEQLPGEWRHRKKNGSTIDVELFLSKMDYSGIAAGLVVAPDITDRKRAEEEKQKFFTLVEYSRDFIAVADLQDHVEYVNPAGRAMLGIPKGQSVRGTNSAEYVAPSDLPLVYETILPALRTAGHWEGELRFRHFQTGRSLPMDFVGFQVKDQNTGEPRFVATVSRDMTERRALERQLQQAQKFEAFGQLAGGIAHDFNNVIGAIQGWAEMGEEQAASSHAVLESYFKKIHTQCDRVTALVQQLLVFARRQVLEPRKLSLNQSVRDVMSLLDKLIGKDIEIKTNLADDLLAVKADPTEIEQLLINLCIHSREAMPKGGTISIETYNASFSAEDARNTADLLSGHFALLQVTDVGVGMDETTQEKICKPFFPTKGTGKGTGLGMTTVYGIVKRHNGFMQVDSGRGRGGTFKIFLPIHGATNQTEFRPLVFHDLPVRGGNETILLADDHDGIREMAYSALVAKGYEVLLAHDGEEATQIYSANRDRITLVLLDVIMPRRSGPEVFAFIKAINPQISVIFASGYANEATVLADLVERGVPILRKPYSSNALCRRVREVLDSVGTVFSDHGRCSL